MLAKGCELSRIGGFGFDSLGFSTGAGGSGSLSLAGFFRLGLQRRAYSSCGLDLSLYIYPHAMA